MQNSFSYKDQISGFQNVSETVKVIEKIAASSVHRLKEDVHCLKEYTTELELTLEKLSLSYEEHEHSFLKQHTSGKKALILLTGDRGLVGGLWHMLINTFLDHASEYQTFIVIGAKGEYYLREEDIMIERTFSSASDVDQMTEYIFSAFEQGRFSHVDVLYPEFFSLADQKPRLVQFLPFVFAQKKQETDDDVSSGLQTFEPSKSKIFSWFLLRYIETSFRKLFMETKLSELSARMITSERASTKTEELIQRLTLQNMKERRRILTQKQLESFTVHML